MTSRHQCLVLATPHPQEGTRHCQECQEGGKTHEDDMQHDGAWISWSRLVSHEKRGWGEGGIEDMDLRRKSEHRRGKTREESISRSDQVALRPIGVSCQDESRAKPQSQLLAWGGGRGGGGGGGGGGGEGGDESGRGIQGAL